MGEPKTIMRETLRMRQMGGAVRNYRWVFNVKPSGNPFTDGDNYWVDAATREEAEARLRRENGLYRHDFILVDRRQR